MHAQRVGVAVAAAAGMLSAFLPWVTFGPMSAAGTDGTDGWIVLGVFAVPFLMAIAGGSVVGRVLSAIAGVLGLACGVFKIVQLSQAKSELRDNPFAGAISPGIGLFVMIIAGLVVIVFAAIRTSPAIAPIAPIAPPPSPPRPRTPTPRLPTPMPQPAITRKRGRTIGAIIAALTLVAISVGGIVWWRLSSNDEPTSGPATTSAANVRNDPAPTAPAMRPTVVTPPKRIQAVPPQRASPRQGKKTATSPAPAPADPYATLTPPTPSTSTAGVEPERAEPAPVGYVSVVGESSTPVYVVIDGHDVGPGPISRREVAVGQHSVKVLDSRSNKLLVEQTVKVGEAQPVLVRYENGKPQPKPDTQSGVVEP